MIQSIRDGFGKLVQVLGLSSGPADIDTDSPLRPSLSWDQDGYNHVGTRVESVAWTIAASTAAATYDLLTGKDAATEPITPDASEQFTLLSLTVDNNAVTIPGDVLLQSAPPTVRHARVSTITDLSDYLGSFEAAFSDSAEFLPTGPLWVPAGRRLQLRFLYATSGGETISVAAMVLRMKAGFRGGAP